MWYKIFSLKKRIQDSIHKSFLFFLLPVRFLLIFRYTCTWRFSFYYIWNLLRKLSSVLMFRLVWFTALTCIIFIFMLLLYLNLFSFLAIYFENLAWPLSLCPFLNLFIKLSHSSMICYFTFDPPVFPLFLIFF